jgi:hypothetical protein
MCRLSGNLGDSTSWNPQGLSRSVHGLLYFVLAFTHVALEENVIDGAVCDWQCVCKVRAEIYLKEEELRHIYKVLIIRLNKTIWI